MLSSPPTGQTGALTQIGKRHPSHRRWDMDTRHHRVPPHRGLQNAAAESLRPRFLAHWSGLDRDQPRTRLTQKRLHQHYAVQPLLR